MPSFYQVFRSSLKGSPYGRGKKQDPDGTPPRENTRTGRKPSESTGARRGNPRTGPPSRPEGPARHLLKCAPNPLTTGIVTVCASPSANSHLRRRDGRRARKIPRAHLPGNASPSVQRRRNPPPSGAMGTRPRRPELPAPLGCPLSGDACRLACAADLDPAPKKPGIPRGSIPPPPQNFRSRKREDRFAIFPANSVKSAAVRTSQAAFSRLPLRPRNPASPEGRTCSVCRPPLRADQRD